MRKRKKTIRIMPDYVYAEALRIGFKRLLEDRKAKAKRKRRRSK